MSIAAIDLKFLKAVRKHGHPTFWEVATYGKGRQKSVTVECTKCGMVLLTLVCPELEKDLAGFCR